MGDIRTVELFAGVGGFRLGLEAASERFKTVWANQWEPSMREQYAFECYRHHFGDGEKHVCKDIAVAKADVPDHDLLVGGFPCQDYSIMKKNSAGIKGSKGVLWWYIHDILKEKRPKFVCWKMWIGSFAPRPSNVAETSRLSFVAYMNAVMLQSGVLSMQRSMDKLSGEEEHLLLPIIILHPCTEVWRMLYVRKVLK